MLTTNSGHQAIIKAHYQQTKMMNNIQLPKAKLDVYVQKKSLFKRSEMGLCFACTEAVAY